MHPAVQISCPAVPRRRRCRAMKGRRTPNRGFRHPTNLNWRRSRRLSRLTNPNCRRSRRRRRRPANLNWRRSRRLSRLTNPNCRRSRRRRRRPANLNWRHSRRRLRRRLFRLGVASDGAGELERTERMPTSGPAEHIPDDERRGEGGQRTMCCFADQTG